MSTPLPQSIHLIYIFQAFICHCNRSTSPTQYLNIYTYTYIYIP